MKIARQAERSVIITFIFAGSKRPGEKRERERGVEKSEETYNETTLATCISMYITRLVVMESHNRECFLLSTSSSPNASFLTCPPIYPAPSTLALPFFHPEIETKDRSLFFSSAEREET